MTYVERASTYFGRTNPAPQCEWQQFAAPPCFWDIGLSPRALFARHHHHSDEQLLKCLSITSNEYLMGFRSGTMGQGGPAIILKAKWQVPPAAASANNSRGGGGQSTNLIGLLRKGQDTWQPPQWGLWNRALIFSLFSLSYKILIFFCYSSFLRMKSRCLKLDSYTICKFE